MQKDNASIQKQKKGEKLLKVSVKPGIRAGVAALVFVFVSILSAIFIKYIFPNVSSSKNELLPNVEKYTISALCRDPHSKADIIVVRNFLPIQLATVWRDSLRQEWMAGNFSHNMNGWRFTTNNNGSRPQAHNINKKTRSLDNLPERLKIANELHNSNIFSYAKWELSVDHVLRKEIEAFMLKDETRTKVTEILASADKIITLSSKEISDIFVTYYGPHNFLGLHNDFSSGAYAFVVSLADGPAWQKGFGGVLSFECPGKKKCLQLAPTFNTLVLFHVRSCNIPHQVSRVSMLAEESGFFRFGFTGWYLNDEEMLGNNDIVELQKMRGY